MYVDKKLAGVDCVQTLSWLNRVFQTKAETGTFILDFVNDPEDIKNAFLPYYKTAQLADVSDTDQVFALYEKLRTAGILDQQELDTFIKVFFDPHAASKNSAAIANLCKPAADRWQTRYTNAVDQCQMKADHFKRCQ